MCGCGAVEPASLLGAFLFSLLLFLILAPGSDSQMFVPRDDLFVQCRLSLARTEPRSPKTISPIGSKELAADSPLQLDSKIMTLGFSKSLHTGTILWEEHHSCPGTSSFVFFYQGHIESALPANVYLNHFACLLFEPFFFASLNLCACVVLYILVLP
jgi:hypothetical protein